MNEDSPMSTKEELINEIKLALQEAGRRLQTYVHKKFKVHRQLERANLFERYIPEVADSLARLTGEDKDKLEKKLQDMIKKDEIQNQIHSMEALKGEVDENEEEDGKESGKKKKIKGEEEEESLELDE